MALYKHEIPLFEYDDSPASVLMPDHEKLNLQLPSKAVFAFLENQIDDYAQRKQAKVAAHFVSATKAFPVYITTYQDQEICLCQAPVGAAPAAQFMDWLIGYGVTEIISAGSCGCLQDLPENTFLVPVRALRDEGTSFHYLPPSRFVDLNPKALKAIESTLTDYSLPYVECTTWTTDGFYRETKEKVAYRREEGCSVVEMECSALAACAQFRGAIFGQILFTADTLADIHNYQARSWGSDSFAPALNLCMEALIRL